MRKPNANDISQLSPNQLVSFLNECLMPVFIEHCMGNRERHFSVNSLDHADAKAALRTLGLKFKFGEYEQGGAGCCAAFSFDPLPPGQYEVYTEATEEMATARAAAIAIVEKTRLFEQVNRVGTGGVAMVSVEHVTEHPDNPRS